MFNKDLLLQKAKESVAFACMWVSAGRFTCIPASVAEPNCN